MKKFNLRLFLLIFSVLLYSAPAFTDSSVVKWDHVDGAEGYIVEIMDSNKITITRDRIKNNYYKIKTPPGKYSFRLIVLNRLGAEAGSSAWKEFTVLSKKQHKPEEVTAHEYIIVISPSYYRPTGLMSELFKSGYGSYLNFGINNFLYKNFETGISTGLFYFKGNRGRYIESAFFMPLRLYSGYNFKPGASFSIFPYMGAGVNLFQAEYSEDDMFKSSRIINPAATAGLSLIFTGSGFVFPVGANSSVMYEKKGILYDYMFYGGFGLLF